jgi:hypothetical protein
MPSSETLRRAALVRTDVSEELSASIIRVTRTGELGITLAVTSNRGTLRRNTGVTRRNIPGNGILHSHRRENLNSYIALTGWALYRSGNVSPMRYELGSYIPEDDILHNHRRENLKSYIALTGWALCLL